MLTTTETPSAEIDPQKTCRLYLFVHWKKGVRYGSETSTYNGDKFSKHDLSDQFVRLLRLFIKDHMLMRTAVFYDKSIPKNCEAREILKWHNGVLEVNRLFEYPLLLNGFQLPPLLK